MACVNALLLGSLLYRSGLVPWVIPLVGLIGVPLLFASDFAVMFGLWGQGSLPRRIAVAPIFLWEVSLGVWLVAKASGPPHPGGTDRAAGSPTPTPHTDSPRLDSR